MQWEYKVTPVGDLFALPSGWQMPASRIREGGATMEKAINHEAERGWEFVNCVVVDGFGWYFVFRKLRGAAHRTDQETAIKAPEA